MTFCPVSRRLTEGLSLTVLAADSPENGARFGFHCTIPPVRLTPNHLPLHKGGKNLIFTLCFLFPSALDSTLETPFPSVRTGDCLAAARSRRGSDMPPACHSLPRRRFATLVGAALRSKTSPLAPLLGSEAARIQHWRNGAALRTLSAPLLGELSAVG